MELDAIERALPDTPPQAIETVTVGGVKTACVSRASLTRLMISECLAARSRHRRPKLIFDTNGQALSLAATSPRYRECLDAADLIHADGQVIVSASKYLASSPIPERSATTDFFHDAAKAASASGLSFFLLGGTQEVSGECASIVRRLIPI